ncbi:1408_t:CDS:2, partial [Scutellospora calospora]
IMVKNQKKPSNSFIIYRTLFQKEVEKHSLKIPIRKLSKMIGECWGKESKIVKDEYERISKEIEKKYYEKWPIPYKIQYKNEFILGEEKNIIDNNINNNNNINNINNQYNNINNVDNQYINYDDSRNNFFSNPDNNCMIIYHQNMINNHQFMVNFHYKESFYIKLPSPPNIENIDDLIKTKKNKKSKKPPNIFFIYRKIYVKELQSKFSDLPQMNFLSPIIAKSWHREEQHIKEEYENLANIVTNHFYELYPNNDKNFFIPKSNNSKINDSNDQMNNLEINNHDLQYQENLQQNIINKNYQN